MKKCLAVSCLALAVVLTTVLPVLAAEVPAALMTAKAGDPEVWAYAEKLKAMGKDGLPEIRKAATAKQLTSAKLALGWALLSLQDFGPGVKVLSSVVSGSADTDAKVCAARILGSLGRNAAEVEVTGLLNAADNDLVKVALAQALTLAATTEEAESMATTALVRLVRTGKGEVRAAAAVVLAELDDFRAPVPAVLE